MSRKRRNRPPNPNPGVPERRRDAEPGVAGNSPFTGDVLADEDPGALGDVSGEGDRRSSSTEAETLRDAVAERPRSRLVDREDGGRERDIRTALDECE